MIALVQKELRLASDVLAVAGLLLVFSFPLAVAGVALQGVRPFPWISVVGAGCVLNQYTLVLTGALLGAAIHTREQEDGSDHFLAMLPISPGAQAAAKLVTGVSVWAALWAMNGLIVGLYVLGTGSGLDPLFPYLLRMTGVLALSFAALGMAGLAGRYVSSVTGAALAGAGVLLIMAVARSIWLAATGGGAFFSGYFLGTLGILGAGGLVLAGWSQGREIAPGQRRRADARARSKPGGASAPGRSRTGALLWKDTRLIRIPLLAGVAVVALPFVAAGGNALVADGAAASGFRTASLLAMALGWIVLPLWSGSSLSSDWSGNTQPFLGSLPVSTGLIRASKLAVAAAPGVVLVSVCVAVFCLAQARIPGEPRLDGTLSWDAFNASHFLGGAVAYASAMPVTFAVAWLFAARLRRSIVAIVLGIVSGPVAMAAWAVTGGSGGLLAAHLPPLPAVVIHAGTLAGLSGLLVLIGLRQRAWEGPG